MWRHPVEHLLLAFVDVGLFQIEEIFLHDAVVNQKGDEDDARQDGDREGDDEERILPDLVLVESSHVVVLYDVAAD